MESIKTSSVGGHIMWNNRLGELHNEYGPALIFKHGPTCWYLHNVLYSEEQYKHEIVKRNLKKLSDW